MCGIGCCLAQAACCLTGQACACCCSACNSSVTTRLMYTIYLLMGVGVSFLMLIPSVQTSLMKIPGFDKFCQYIGAQSNCSLMVGYTAVYRLMFAFTAFFFLLALLMIGVKSSKDIRSKVQNGFWFFKLLVLIGICVGAFYIPNPTTFANVWFYFGLVGGFFFILTQLFQLVDLAHIWNKLWIVNYNEGDGALAWFIGLCVFMTTFFVGALTIFIVILVHYANESHCVVNKAVVSINFILCVAVSILSILPQVQNANPRSGLLQSSFISLFVMYLTWSAFSNEPPTDGLYCGPPDTIVKINDSEIIGIIVGVLIAIVTITYTSLRSVSSEDPAPGQFCCCCGPIEEGEVVVTATDGDTAEKGKVVDNEVDNVSYSYTLYHCMLMVASLYLMMTITEWSSPSAASVDSTTSRSWAAVWVKISSSWFCIIIYVWTIIAPIVLPDREFPT